MRHSIKRISKSALSVILALMMVVSTMVVGITTFNAATISATIYIDCTNQSGLKPNIWVWDNSNNYTGGSWPGKPMTLVSGNIYKYTFDVDDSNIDNVNVIFNNGIGRQTDTINLKSDAGSDWATKSKIFTLDAGDSGNYTGSWKDYTSGSDEPTPVTDTNLISVLKGEKVMFYGGEPSNWDNISTFFVMTEDNISKAIASGSISSTAESLSTSGDSYKFATLCAPVGTYYLGHWASGLSTEISAGGTYVIRKSTTTNSGYTQLSYNNNTSDPNYLYGYNNDATLTATTTCTLSGDTLTVNTSSDKGKSTIGKDNSFKYYITSDNATFTEYTLTDGTLDTSALEDGTYTLKTVLYDGNIYVVGNTTTFTVQSIPQLATPDISFDSTTIAAADGSYVTLTVNNHSTYTSLSDVTVTYKLFNGDSEVTTASFDSNGKCQISEAGTYKVQAVSSDTSKYTNSEYSTATTIEKAAAPEYYVSGRFRVKVNDEYVSIKGSYGWCEKNTDANFKFTLVNGSTDLYYLDTGCTLKELSDSIDGGLQYFKIYDKTSDKSYNNSNTNLQNCVSLETAQVLEKCDDSTGSTDDADMYFSSTDTNGTVTLYLKNDNGTLKLYYSLVGDKTPLNAPTIESDRASLTASNPTATITVTPATYPYGVDVEYYLYNGDKYVDKTTGTTFTVSSAGTYTVKAYPPADNPNYKESVASNSVIIADSRTPVTLNAMNGIAGTTVAKAANTNSSVSGETSIEGGKTYTVTKGSTVTVTSTMTADTTTAEKFVYAYVVNNKDTYLATEGIAVTKDDKKYATYSATFTIAEDATETTFTVVPIYYYKACAKDGEYIKFYVDKSDTTGWGNNLYNYAYYYKKAGDTKDVYESDGIWPGQPMLYDETKQLYYSLVPKQIGGKLVSGLTVNIGSDQLQSFDFDDFKVINEIGYDIVRLDLKQRSGHTQNKVTLFGDADATAYDKGNKTFITPTYTYSNLVSDFSGRWESYKDINGNDVSLLGMAVNPENTNTTYIVSSATHDSERGQWMSAFSVYKVANDGTVTYVTTAFPSDFIPRIVKDDQTEATANTSAYNAILDAGLGDALVKIVYEDQVSTRIDGRWYYAQSDSEVSAYAYYRTYETTDCSGTPSELLINKDYSKIIAETELINDDGIVIGGKNSTLKKEISVVSSPLAGYIFDHWSVVDKAGNIIIDKLENVGSSFTTTLDQEIHYVANFRKATQGQIEIKHSKYSGVGAKNGLGYYRLEVKVLKENGEWTSVATGSGTGANGHTVTISDLAENDKIVRIKLITETAGENTFRYWYTDSSDGTEIIEDPDGDMTWNGTATSEPYGKNGILTYTFDTEVWKLFSGKISQLNFYSDIAPMTKNYKLTYLYDDRFGNQKSYVVTGTHDDSYYVKNENSWAPNEELIYAKAPYIDDLYKDCTWTMAQCTKDGTDATLTAVQTSKKYTVKIYDSTGEASDPYLLPINSYVYVKNVPGQFYVADPEDSNGNKFNYWSVTENGIEVTRQYQRMYTLVVLGNYVIKPVYDEEAATDAVYISKPQYTREQTKSEDGKIVTDKLYVDFMVSYMSADGSLIMNNTGKYDTGILIEFGQHRKFAENPDGTLNIDYVGNKYNSDTNELIEAATGTASKVKYTYSGDDAITNDNRVIYKYDINEEKYNNMNRLDYFASFVNSTGNQKYVYKAYYYVRVKNADGSYGEPIISNAVYFNLYEVGTSDPNTVNTSTT